MDVIKIIKQSCWDCLLNYWIWKFDSSNLSFYFLNKKDAFILMNISMATIPLVIMASGIVENYATISPSRSARCASKVIPKKLRTRYNKGVQANCKAKGEKYGTKGSQFIAHKVALFYYIVFTPKYRRKVIYNQYRSSLGEIFHRLCSYKGVEIIEGHLMPDHVDMLVGIPAEDKCFKFYGVFKRQKCTHDV